MFNFIMSILMTFVGLLGIFTSGDKAVIWGSLIMANIYILFIKFENLEVELKKGKKK